MKSNIAMLAILLVTVCSAIRYCEVQDSNVNVFATSNEVQQIQLSKHFRGYNLNFESSNPQVVAVYEPWHVAEEAQLELKDGYAPINVDSRNSKNNLWGRDGVVVAQGSPINLAIGYGSFKNDVLPSISNFTYFTLPKDADCYSGHIFDNTFSVVVDCESSSNNQDLLCLLRSDGSKQCSSYDSITSTGKRANILHSIDTNQYLFSAATTTNIDAPFKNETFINIYHIRDNGADFNMIIDRRTLGLDSLSITDLALMDLNAVTYVVVADASGKLIMFRYMPDNTVGDIKTLNIEGSPLSIQVTPYSELMVATSKEILVYTYSSQSGSISLSKRYQIDASDNSIIDIQSSISHITVRTASHNVYTYDRKHTEIRYLLNKEQITADTAMVVSPFYPRTFHINGTHMRSVALTQGYLYVGSVVEDTKVTVTGMSGDLSCKINISIKKVADGSKIYQKKDVPATYRFQNEDSLTLNLNAYFGGRNLNYDVKDPKSKDIQTELQHFKNFKQSNLAEGEDIILYKIVEIDENSYWFVTFSKETIRFWQCQASNSSVNCQEDLKSKINNNGKIIKMAESGWRQDGSLVLIWTYETPMFGYKVLGKNGFTFVMTYDSRYSSVLIGKKYICLVEKEMNRLNFFDGQKLNTFSADVFDEEQLARMGGGFYPRDIYADPHNPYLFYVKFPVSIVTIAYVGEKQIEILTRTEISKDYIPDNQWALLFGPETLLLFSSGAVSEYVLLPDSTVQLLHKINTDGNVILPATYQETTNSAFFVTDTGALQYIKLNQNSIESEYYKIPHQGISFNNGDWSISESWLYLSSGDVYYQYKTAQLKIKANVPDTLIKEDFTIDLSVANDGDKQQVVSKITAYNYPSTIKATQTGKTVSLPEAGEGKVINFNLDDYFTGSVTSVTIQCPFTTDKSISVVPPFQLVKDSESVKEIYDIVALPDNSGILTLYNNAITLSDLNNKVINSVGIDSKLSCQWMDANVKDIIVLCKGDTAQEIVWLKLNDDSTDITVGMIYPLPAEAALQNPYQIACYGHNGGLTVVLHDKEENVYSQSSTIKLIQIEQELSFKGSFDSTIFGTTAVEPMNSFDVRGKHMLVTIGGKGLGYVNLESFGTTAKLIDLAGQAEISEYTLENSQFVRVSIHSLTIVNDGEEMSVFVTTSNSLHYLIGVKAQLGSAVFTGVKEIYNKYSHQRPLNWIAHNDEHLIMAYYNETTSVKSIVLYKRGTKKPTNFIASSQFVVPMSNLHTPRSVLVDSQVIGKKSSLLFIEENTKPSSSAALGMYNITGTYGLKVTYKQPGNFDTIKVTAKNDYSTATRDIKVEFAGDKGGHLKWYSVLIVICLVLIAVGVAFGLYLKMKSRKVNSKKVSLFTENEEVDETI